MRVSAAILVAWAGVAAAQNGPSWLATCTNTGADGAMVCAISQSIVVQTTGARVMTATLRTAPETPARLELSLPHGMLLPAGVRIAVDEAEGPAEAVRTCDAEGCHLSRDLSADELALLLAGRELRVTFQDLSGRDIALTLNLEGLAEAHGAVGR